MKLDKETFENLRNNVKPNLPKLIAHGIHIVLNELMPQAGGDVELKARYDIIISGYLSMALYADLATEAPYYIIQEYFENNSNGLVLGAGATRSYFIGYSYEASLAFRTHLFKITNDGGNSI